LSLRHRSPLSQKAIELPEALDSGSFMLSDDGSFPKNLTPGKDFITYRDNTEILDKMRLSFGVSLFP
jgi:spore maturation protein CgeB